jgi:hypothetical protein
MRETEAQTIGVSSNDGETINRLAETNASACDPYDPANLRLSSEYLKSGGVKKLLTTVPVRRPNKQEFVRVHPDPDYRLCGVAVVELTEEQETYLVAPTYAHELSPEEFTIRNILTVINRQGVVFLWPIKLPGPDGKRLAWHTSAKEGANTAMKKWVRFSANKSLGAYELHLAQNIVIEPEWPKQPFKELLEIGFRDRIIHGPDHPVMLRLRGAL